LERKRRVRYLLHQVELRGEGENYIEGRGCRNRKWRRPCKQWHGTHEYPHLVRAERGVHAGVQACRASQDGKIKDVCSGVRESTVFVNPTNSATLSGRGRKRGGLKE